MTAPTRICIFAKPPVAGHVKTRLIPAVGAIGAAGLARAFLVDASAAVRALPWATPVIATTGALEPSLAPGIPTWPQGEGDLGARLERVLIRALLDAPRTIAIGTDSPGLPSRLLANADAALASADAAIGPTADGGFYLLALRRCPPGLLAELPWESARHVRAHARAAPDVRPHHDGARALVRC